MASVIFWVDPYQLFGKQPFAKPSFFETTADTERQRLHAFGLIYSYLTSDRENNGIVIGSSRTVGMSSAQIAKALNLNKVANLSLNGGRGFENRVLAKRALEIGGIRAVIWEVDYWFIDPRERPGRTPGYLKTPTRIDDLQYLVTPYVFLDAIDLARGSTTVGWSTKLDTLGSPMKYFTRSSFEQASSTIATRLKVIPRTTAYRAGSGAGMFPRLDQDMIEVVGRYPDVDFYLFFPVVPNILYASSNPDFFPAWIAGRRYLVEQFKDMQNVKIFAFDNDPFIAGNLANFFNENHYGHGVDGYLLNCFLVGCNQLSMANIGSYETEFIKRIDNFKARYDTARALGYDQAWNNM